MIKKFLTLFSLQIFFCALALPQNKPTLISNYSERVYRDDIQTIYRKTISATDNIEVRVKKISHFFLGKPYILGALGEGRNAKFDESPFYRTDGFDCMTFVSTVLALSFANTVAEFEKNLKDIQYAKGLLAYTNRYHFLELDWNQHNQSVGYFVDVTNNLCSDCRKSIVLIDKPAWYKKANFQRIKLLHPVSTTEAQQLLTALQNCSVRQSASFSTIPYISLNQLFILQEDHKVFVREDIFVKIPSPAIIEIIDRTRNIKAKIGTELSVSHLGFVIKVGEQLMFRHASQNHRRIVDVPLIQYLYRYYIQANQPQLIGINVQKILEKTNS